MGREWRKEGVRYDEDTIYKHFNFSKNNLKGTLEVMPYTC